MQFLLAPEHFDQIDQIGMLQLLRNSSENVNTHTHTDR